MARVMAWAALVICWSVRPALNCPRMSAIVCVGILIGLVPYAGRLSKVVMVVVTIKIMTSQAKAARFSRRCWAR